MDSQQTRHPGRVTRRDLLRSSTFLGGSAALASSIPWVTEALGGRAEAGYLAPTQAYTLAQPENVIYTTCLQCQIRCLLKVKQHEGVVVKVDGSPYSAKNFLPNIPYDTSPKEAATIDGMICPKGHSAIEAQYDPYRIRRVLKRAGPRGSGRWQTIDFHKAIEEIVEGGDLFGEGRVTGLREVWALRDGAAATQMAADVDGIRKGTMTIAQFKEKHRGYLDTLIDPDHPDLGPRNNQLVFQPGRINRGRVHFARRWLQDSFGSVSIFPHTSICELSIFVNTSEMTRDPETGASKSHFKPDFLNSEFIIFWGTGFAEANFGLTAMAKLVTTPIAERNLKFAVIDPRLSKSAGKAWRWVPVTPGTDLALALGMMRWIIENERFDRRYLENANLTAANKDGEPTVSDATHLVRMDTMVFLRAEDAGLAVPPQPPGTPGKDYFVVMTPEGPRRYDDVDHGVLEVTSLVNGIPVKSVFTLLKERAMEKSLEEYARICGVEPSRIAELAREFTGHGKKAAIDIYRGVAKHYNGFYTVQAVNALSVLIGNVDWKGGLADGGGSWDDLGGREGQPFPLSRLHPGKTRSFGVPLSREGWAYEESSLFQRDGGYPARRPWYPFAFEMYHDVIPAAEAGYPYPIKILWLHQGTPAYSVPGAGEQLRILRDPKAIPLLIATDIVIGDTSMYADYIFPDLFFLERWASPGDVPQPPVKSNPIRQPTAPPIPETVIIDGEEMPISMEAVMIAIAKRLGLPGWGKDGFRPGAGLDRPEDYYLKIVANLAWGDRPGDAVPDAGDGEVELFVNARRHLPRSVFDATKWENAVTPQHWRKTVYVLNRGGRFEHFSRVYDGNYMAHRFGKAFHLYIERVATARDSISGKRYDGLPRYEPPPDPQEEYPFRLITYKESFGGQARSAGWYWSQVSLMPENTVQINRLDAERLGLRNGDTVKLVSRSNPDGVVDLGNDRRMRVAGKVRVREGLRPGTVAVSHHFGHWAYGAQEVAVDGRRVKGDPRRGRGLQPNMVMLLDRVTKTSPVTDPIGGSAAFFDTKVAIEKV